MELEPPSPSGLPQESHRGSLWALLHPPEEKCSPGSRPSQLLSTQQLLLWTTAKAKASKGTGDPNEEASLTGPGVEGARISWHSFPPPAPGDDQCNQDFRKDFTPIAAVWYRL